jgi:hypothetical protein
MMSSLSRIDIMIYEYNNARRENAILLLLKVRKKSKHNSKKKSIILQFIWCKHEAKTVGSNLTYDRRIE